MEPTKATEDNKLRLGKKSAAKIAMQIKAKKHSAPVILDATQPGLPSHMDFKNTFITEPPIIMYNTHVPPDRYIVGKIASNLPSFSPMFLRHRVSFYDLIV